MNTPDITYREKTAPEAAINLHVAECSDSFSPPLGERVNLKDYSSKIAKDAITFEAWAGTKLIGLVAAYFNDPKKQTGYISNVSTDKAFLGKGIATTLMRMCIEYAREHNFNEIKLEADRDSRQAINLYEKYHFKIVARKESVIEMTLDCGIR